jgi:predicted ATPase/DNA-binding CsgD family transcriptional regulator
LGFIALDGFRTVISEFPLHSTPFVGRENELRRISELMSDPACRLLTLVGPGGIGKTRLANHAAQHFPNAHFVPLQPLTSPDFMLTAIANALHVQFYPGGDPKQQLLDYLREKAWLLVLDNFEHLLEGAAFLSEILAYAPRLRMLITSRERLNLVEEWVLEIGGLTYPIGETNVDAERYSAVELFVQRVRQAKVGFTLTDANYRAVARICRLVDGMPLAIELAANWVRSLSCDAIANEIERSLDILETPVRNVEPRHRTMRAAFEPTWAGLGDDEQKVFMRLSVFRGGFTREAAEAIVGASLRTLMALVDKSLLRVDITGRYDIHELLRQYGQERLNESPCQPFETFDRHCSYYLRFLADQWPRLTGSAIKASMRDIHLELENVRTAWDWALHQQKAAEIEACLNSLWFFYDERARYREGEQTFARAVAAFWDSSPAAMMLRAKLQSHQGALCHLAGMSDNGTGLLREAVRILRQTDARGHLAFALHRLGIALLEYNLAFADAAQYLCESLAIFTELNDRWHMAHVLNWLSIFHHKESAQHNICGALERAEQCAWESLSLFQQLQSVWGIAAAYLNLADVAYLVRDYQQCMHYSKHSFECFREIGSFWGTSISLMLMGDAACLHGAYAEARRCALQGLQSSSEFGLISINFYSLHHLNVLVHSYLGKGELERAYELMGLLDQQRQRSTSMGRQHSAFAVLVRLQDEMPDHLAVAVERGRAADSDTVVKDIIREFTESIGYDDTPSSSADAKPIFDGLTERELEILRLVAEGCANQEIADQLFIGVSTVKKHLNHIFDKLNVKNRTQAVARSRECGLLN